MKKEIISTSIIALLTLSSFLAIPGTAQAQSTKKMVEEKEEKQPFFQGAYAAVEVFGLINKALGSDITSTELSMEANLWNKYFPMVEIGYGSMDATHDQTDIYYKTSAPFFRIGAGYNVFHKKPYLPGQLLIGLRYGFTSFTYDLTAPTLVDPNWGHTQVPMVYEGMKSNCSWLELTVGLKAQVYKSFYMGLNVRYRSRISMKRHENSEPLYIPGFGMNGSNNFGLTYSLIYKLPF